MTGPSMLVTSALVSRAIAKAMGGSVCFHMSHSWSRGTLPSAARSSPRVAGLEQALAAVYEPVEHLAAFAAGLRPGDHVAHDFGDLADLGG